jgi:ethanolamine ammonia-lyase small subunit
MTPERAAEDVWAALRRFTAARIGLKRSGPSLATGPLLDFRLAHARARDAVHEALDESQLVADLDALGIGVLTVASAAADRQTYLMRPDLGRRLTDESGVALATRRGRFDVAFVIADGLSARAVIRHATPVLTCIVPALMAEGWSIAPLVVARQGRVAIGDAIANALNANSVVILIGERPGLSAPDSLGAYLTWQPGATTSDAERNCISNIRPEGIDYETAGFRLAYMLRAMRARCLSGVALKDDSDRLLIGV